VKHTNACLQCNGKMSTFEEELINVRNMVLNIDQIEEFWRTWQAN